MDQEEVGLQAKEMLETAFSGRREDQRQQQQRGNGDKAPEKTKADKLVAEELQKRAAYCLAVVSHHWACSGHACAGNSFAPALCLACKIQGVTVHACSSSAVVAFHVLSRVCHTCIPEQAAMLITAYRLAASHFGLSVLSCCPGADMACKA